MKCCPEFCPWRRFRQGLGPFFYANMAPETAASGHSLQQRTASQPASQEDPPLLILALSCQKRPRALLDFIARSTRIPGAKRAAREHHVTLCERGQDLSQKAI